MADAGDLGVLDAGPFPLDATPPGDLGVDAGPPEFLASCEPCALDSECAPTSRCLALPSGVRACVPTCDVELPTCPRAFECTNAAGGAYVCSPINGACCIDEDADGYGSGIGCAGLDCNDVDATVNPAAPEQCNDVDDDCDGTVDGFAASCGEQRCGEAATSGRYEEIGPGTCEEGACLEGVRTPCGLYACEGGISTGLRCATTCTNAVGADDDALCAAIAHCEAGVCVDDLVDGSTCDEDTDCAGARCDNGFCCNGGICCNAPSDCPTTGGFISVCDSPAGCQGTTGAPSCVDFVCGTVAGVPDDSGCSTSVVANECGFFLPVRCTGAEVQSPPFCPSTCADDAECDAVAHCDVVCLPDLADGQSCDEASDCVSGYCNNGVCCAGGDCCVRPGDCPASYANPARCEVPNACQGTRDAATCVGFVCNTTANVPDDSACSAGVLADACGSYPSRFCTGAVDQPPPSCASSCASDGECDADAHCDAGACVPDLDAGRMCDEASDCRSDYCSNGFCCAGGDCCALARDCPAEYSSPPRCESGTTCQGSRDAAVCIGFVCNTMTNVADDSACDSGVVADECGAYPARFCTGAVDQRAPVCGASCAADGECDASAHCDASACVPDVESGLPCDEASDCVSGYCNNGLCCSGGDCCARPSDCPASYSTPPRCEVPNACQGTRDAATCVGFVCGTTTNVPDDSACNVGVLADACGAYPSRFCSGTADQSPPVCATACSSDGECDADAHCDAGACVPDLEAGRMCDEASDCRSAYCNNGYCCSSGDCCNSASDCPAAAYGRPSTCASAASCQGDRVDPICTATKQCAAGPTVADDSGCVGLEANNCGAYPAVSCTSAVTQPMPMCATGCASDAECDATAFCNASGACVSRGGAGAACGGTGECASGLSCVDGVCCTSACTGTCRACNVPGSEGTCTNVPARTDPANECGAVSCAAYFTSPTGATIGGSCNQVANLPAAEVFCSGSASCESAATLCPGRTVAGMEVLDCDNTCQLLSGCAGTSPGRCDAYTPPTNAQSCGIGQCANTVAVCSMGALVTCTPRAPSTETCDNLDNDCDGLTDEGCDDDNDDFCDAGLGYVAVPAVCPRGGSDCNDSNAAVNPGATEVCNGVDDDCTLGPDQGRTCVRCGDGLIDVTYGEVCDDGNATSGDGCNGTCTAIECAGFPSGTSYVAPSGNCYWRSTEVVGNRSTAASRCSARGMHLLYLETSAERTDIRGNLIGFSSTSRVYVGLDRTTVGCRSCGNWLNGVALSYNFFRSGEPSGDGTCAEWGPGELDGNDIPCSTSRDFVCERERAGTVRVLP
jgi:hypothetical protein